MCCCVASSLPPLCVSGAPRREPGGGGRRPGAKGLDGTVPSPPRRSVFVSRPLSSRAGSGWTDVRAGVTRGALGSRDGRGGRASAGLGPIFIEGEVGPP